MPATFRSQLDDAPVEMRLADAKLSGFVAFPSHTLPAIEGYTYGRIDSVSRSVDRLDLFSEEREDFAAMIFANSHRITLDGDGRLILPKLLLDHAGITDEIAFVGRGGTFQIWEPKAYAAHQATTLKRAQEKRATLAMVADRAPNPCER